MPITGVTGGDEAASDTSDHRLAATGLDRRYRSMRRRRRAPATEAAAAMPPGGTNPGQRAAGRST